jgi:2-keto-myo-inositol isomerase
MRWAINQITLNGGSRRAPGDLPADLAAVRAGGWTAIEVWLAHWDGFVARQGMARARRALDASGLVAAGGCGAEVAFFASRGARAASLDRLERRLALCQALGAPHLVVAPGFTEPAEPSPAAFELAVENVRAAGELATRYGVRLGIECLAGARMVRSLSAAVELARRVALAGVGVIVDTYHLYAGISKLEDLELLRGAPAMLTFVHVSDVAGDTLRELWSVADRELPLPPGEGGVPNGRMLTTIRALGYDGDVSLELFSAAFESRWRADPEGAAREAYHACTALTDRLGWPAR